MIVMLDTPQPLDECAAQLGAPVEQFFSPQTYRRAQFPERHFCVDNGAFGNFDGALFLRLLQREKSRMDLCRFVAVPDVVASAARTREVFDLWAPQIEEWPLAYVVQDGQEHTPIPWDRIAAIFIGATTQWKEGPHAAACIKAAKMFGKWVHAGRVNTPARFEHFEKLGADSIDGTGLARYDHMRTAIYERHMKPELPLFAA